MKQPVTVDQLFQRSRDENVLNSVLLELTYGCNLDCSFCYNDLDLRGQRMSLEDYCELIDDLAAMGVMALTLSGGEPLVYRHFFAVGAYARQRGFMITVKSNGVPLNESNCKRLREEVDPFKIETSLHGACAATHDRQTRVPGSFDRLLRNIPIVQAHNMRILANAALTRWNESEVGEMFALADRLNVSLRFDPDITPRDNGDKSPLEIEPSKEGIENMVRLSLRRAQAAAPVRPDSLPLSIKPKSPPAAQATTKAKVCGAGSTNITIDPFGNVYPCVQFRRKIGNVHDQPVSELWTQSPELVQVRNTAAKAYDEAARNGISQYCMGSAELKSGDALRIPEATLETAKIYQRVNWEVFGDEPDSPAPRTAVPAGTD